MYLAFQRRDGRPEEPRPDCPGIDTASLRGDNGGQTSMDFAWWQKWIPQYERPHRDPAQVFNAKTEAEIGEIVKEISALSLITADDPPIHMSYGMAPDDPVPTDPKRANGWKVHHVMFGVKLKEQMDKLGIDGRPEVSGRKDEIPVGGTLLQGKAPSRPVN